MNLLVFGETAVAFATVVFIGHITKTPSNDGVLE